MFCICSRTKFKLLKVNNRCASGGVQQVCHLQAILLLIAFLRIKVCRPLRSEMSQCQPINVSVYLCWPVEQANEF